jgi:iron complex outermembrane recepter protein
VSEGAAAEIGRQGEKVDKRGFAYGAMTNGGAPNFFVRSATLLRTFAICISFLVIPACPAWPQQQTADLANQSLEDLMNVQVVSASKTEESLSRTAAAIFVITREDIRRSGATNIPDLLRMVPGMDVSQINANTWAISARGFNARFSSELFVMVDGRSVYTPSFGGVFWDTLDLPLEDIERIEVIRGPGGSIWGTNAVNGVINIITKKTSETKGALVTAGGGNIDQGFGTAQYGGAVGKSTDYRVYAKYFDQDHLPGPTGMDGGDGWHALRGGFRIDSTLSSKDTLTFQGDMYSIREGTPTTQLTSINAPATVPIELLVNITGGFLQGVWTHTYSPRSGTTLQVSYEQYRRSDDVGDHRGTLNLDFGYHIAWGARNNLVWGLNFRDSDSHSHGLFFTSFVPVNLNTQLYGAFIQDEIAIRPDRLYLTVGIKVEHNYYTGAHAMPSARVAWTPTAKQTVWAAVSNAIRSPSALDAGFRSDLGTYPGPGGVPVLLALIGNSRFDDESLIAYEAGYRTTIAKRLSIDFASYYNDYDHQETTEPAAEFSENTPPPPHVVMPLTFENLMHGETHGAEVAATWKVTNRWTLNPGYAFEEIHMHLYPTSHDTTSVSATEGSSPDHSAQLRSRVELPHGLTWDTSAYFVGRLTDPSEPSYTRLDTQLSWKFSEGATLSLVGQNLVRNLHEEFVDATGSARTTLIKRSAYIKFTWKF